MHINTCTAAHAVLVCTPLLHREVGGAKQSTRLMIAVHSAEDCCTTTAIAHTSVEQKFWYVILAIGKITSEKINYHGIIGIFYFVTFRITVILNIGKVINRACQQHSHNAFCHWNFQKYCGVVWYSEQERVVFPDVRRVQSKCILKLCLW